MIMLQYIELSPRSVGADDYYEIAIYLYMLHSAAWHKRFHLKWFWDQNRNQKYLICFKKNLLASLRLCIHYLAVSRQQ